MANGQVETIVSDGNWQWNTGPLTFACIVGGEDWDARKVDPDWSTNSGSSRDWQPVRSAQSPEVTLRPQIMPPIRVVDRFRPASITTPQPGRHVIDAGKVLAGWVSLELPADVGREVVIPFNERLTEDGLVDRQFFTKNNPDRF